MMRNKKGKEVARSPSRDDAEGASGDVDPRSDVKGKGIAYSSDRYDDKGTPVEPKESNTSIQ